MHPLSTFLILDFKKPEETRICLESIRARAKFPHLIHYLDNGSNEDYVWELKKSGLIDVLISNVKNTGCGNGMEQLYQSCQTDYCFMVQNDQFLAAELSEYHYGQLVDLIEKQKFGYVDLAGAQAGPGNYSDRAGFFKRDFYLSIPKGKKFQLGGPGPFNHLTYSEQYIQEYFKANNLKVAHIQPVFGDNGKISIREMGDGLYWHRCDTKLLKILKAPTYRTEVFPAFTDSEWEEAIGGRWPEEGKIPEMWKEHSFVVWG